MADNTITIIGNITRDPELRFTPNGQPVATFGMAVNRRWQNRQNQEWEEATSFFDIVCWGSLADNVSESLGRGARVIVNGRLEQRSWETQDGEKRSKVEVVADEVGPSLRWATARPEKTARRDGQQGGGANQGGPRDSYANQGGQRDQGTREPAAVPAAGSYDSADEEPF
jgi:single-strand DNA-binding protein